MLKAAVIQEPPVFLNLQASIDKACGLIETAAGAGAKVIAFPETWLPGYPLWLDFAPNAGLWDHPPAKALFKHMMNNCVSITNGDLKPLLAAAAKTGSYVIMGAQERDGGTIYNTIIYIAPDNKTFRIHRKLVPTYTERLVWGQGDGSTLNVLETEFGNIGGLVCWEHWMPLARAAMHAKKEAIHIAQWPMVKDLHHIASRQYAFEGQCFVLAAGCVL
ncbi:MAG: carbon-nitrogen hydrolase family protein, partial [Gammaproteobacteria bacterium]|nr:carbon-nitrogen hydrolase family protein [Gammaproteobacteria bacterium]